MFVTVILLIFIAGILQKAHPECVGQVVMIVFIVHMEKFFKMDPVRELRLKPQK